MYTSQYSLYIIHYEVWMGGKYSSFFSSIFSDIYIFSKYKKNKIGILENDIYIFSIVNSVLLLVHIVWAVCTIFGRFRGYAVRTIYPYQMTHILYLKGKLVYQKNIKSISAKSPPRPTLIKITPPNLYIY